jgi:glycyl-tRNA synthetase beta chain
MTDFLLELLSEEIPARMQGKASEQLAKLFSDQLSSAGLQAQSIETYATPRRLALIARGLPAETAAVREETKGPRTSAPPQALEGFLRKTGLTQDQLVERDGVYFAVADKPGRATSEVLAEAIPAIVRAFPWPKSMRWGSASASTESLRWVRPLQGIVALFGEEIVDFEVAGIRSGAATVGHRFHHPGAITIGSANDYVEKLRACHVILDPAERRRIIAEGAAAAAAAAGLTLVEDQGLLEENAGLTEWPVPLLGSFDPEFLQVPPEVIQLTMRTNQKYFALRGASPERGGGPRASAVEGAHLSAASESGPLHHPADGPPPRSGEEQILAPNFICTANIDAADGGRAIVEGNRKVLAARLSDARFFWEQDLKIPLEQQAEKLTQIVFHEKLGTVADKVDRVAKLARWLVEEGIVGAGSSPERGGGPRASAVEGAHLSAASESGPLHHPSDGPPPRTGEELAALAERAARLCKADLVTQMVGEFPELQGLIGGYLARAQGEPDEVADAIRDHYKPVGQADEVPTAPVTVAVSLADKLDTIFFMAFAGERASGSRDPYALRRSSLGVISLLVSNQIRLSLDYVGQIFANLFRTQRAFKLLLVGDLERPFRELMHQAWPTYPLPVNYQAVTAILQEVQAESEVHSLVKEDLVGVLHVLAASSELLAKERFATHDFFADRLKVQQREAGVRHDLIDAVFALGGEDDLVRLLARVRALQAFVETPEGADLLAGYKRAANILKKEGWGGNGTDRHPGLDPGSTFSSGAGSEDRWMPDQVRHDDSAEQSRNTPLSYTPEKEEAALIAALDSAEPRARAAVGAEDFEGAMAALASLRAPVDAFFDKVTVNDPDPAKRAARLDLLARMRAAVHQVADFSRIEG